MLELRVWLFVPLAFAFGGVSQAQETPEAQFEAWISNWCDRPQIEATDQLNLAIVQEIEEQVSKTRKVALNPDANPIIIKGFARYYAVSKTRKNEIHGRWIKTPPCDDRPKIQLTTFDSLPIVFDGGCSVVSLVWDSDTRELTYLACNGVA